MSLHLGDWVECGEIYNTRRYSVHGWIQLRGREQPVVLELTGNCGPDLAGWHCRFQAQEGQTGAPCTPPAIAWEQIGPTGTMTAARKVDGGEPAEQSPRCLYLEWFGQNGRVVVELPDPVLEFVEFVELPDAWSVPPPADIVPPPVADDEAVDQPAEEDEEEEEEAPGACDCFSVVSQELERQFELRAEETDRAIADHEADADASDEDKPQLLREMELMDELIEGGEGELICGLFEGPLRLPCPDAVDNAGVEEALKSLLAELARFNIAVDVCEHFTPRDAYRLLVERICPQERAYPELRSTQWIQHFSTAEFCERCEAESARELDDYDRHRGDGPPDEAGLDDELPF
jgi:hypothetical protein